MRPTSLTVSITHVLRYLGPALLPIALSLPLSPASSVNPENADDARLKQECNRTKFEAALFNAYREQLARVDATDLGNEAAVRAQSARAPARRGGLQPRGRTPCTGTCP
jgi:hypothetical protein